MNNLVGVEGFVVYCPLLGRTRNASDCITPGGDSCEYYGGLDTDSWSDENDDPMVAILCKKGLC